MFSPSIPSKQNKNFFFLFFQTKRPPKPKLAAPHENALVLFFFVRQGIEGFVVSSKRKQTVYVSSMLFTFLSVSSSSASSASCSMRLKYAWFLNNLLNFFWWWLLFSLVVIPLSQHCQHLPLPTTQLLDGCTMVCSWSAFVQMKCKWLF